MNWVLAAPAAPRRRKKGAAYAGGSETRTGPAAAQRARHANHVGGSGAAAAMARWAAVVRRRRWRGGRLPERGGEGACARAGQRARMNGLVCIRSLLTRTCTGAVLLPHPPLLWAVAASAAAEHPGRPATGPVALAAAGASRSRPARAGRGKHLPGDCILVCTLFDFRVQYVCIVSYWVYMPNSLFT